MNALFRFSNDYLPAFGKNWQRFMLWGIALLALGILAIGAATFTTFLTVIFLGFLIVLSGAIMVMDTITFWWGKWSGFLLHFGLALLYLMVGILLITNPLQGSLSLTLLLGLFYIIIGLARIFYSSGAQSPKWGWSLANGVIALILGILIITNWPASSLYMIGLFVGLDLIFLGWAYIMAALAARSLLK